MTGHARRAGRRCRSAAPVFGATAPGDGFSLIELMFVTGLVGVLSALAMPYMLAGIDEWRTSGAARYVSTRLYHARMEAVRRSANTAVRFVRAGGSYEYTVVLDGNGNGVRSRELAEGVDIELRAPEGLREHFAEVDFGALPGLPPVDPDAPPPGDDPVRFGSSDMVTFSAHGTSTPGSLYIRGRSAQYVVRVFGETGKIRILKFDPRLSQWKPL